jgi:hypothetical protein
LKNNLVRFFVNIWLVLSEVPGWPDAPLALRMRRNAPMLIPLIGVVALAGWKLGWISPEMEADQLGGAPLVALDEEVAALRLACSEQQAAEVAAQSRAAAATLIDSSVDVAIYLRQWREKIRASGWEATFQAYDAPVGPDAEAGGVVFATARATLLPVAGRPEAFSALLGIFDQISGADKRIDLTRLGVRADVPGKLEVELNLRLACRAVHEKAL